MDKIFQVFINDSGTLPAFAGYPAHAMQSLRALYPGAQYRLLGGQEVRELIGAHFPRDVAEAYDALKPYAYKTDLARYCLLHLHGGLYVDVGVLFVQPLRIPAGLSFFAFRDRNMHTRKSFAVATAIIHARKGCPVLQHAIEGIVGNCKARYYGVTPLCPTGPTLLGRAVCAQDAPSVLCPGELTELTPRHPQRNAAYVLDTGQIVAMAKPTAGGDLKGLGLAGTNNYNDFWTARDVYATANPGRAP